MGSEKKEKKHSGSPKVKKTQNGGPNKNESRLLNRVIASLSGVQQDQDQHCH